MNILYLNSDNRGGGSTQALFNFISGMRLMGHAVFVLTKDNDGLAIDEFRKLGADVYLSKFELSYYPNSWNPYNWIKSFFGNLIKWHRLIRKIEYIIVSKHIDIVHTNVGPLPFALFACQKHQIPHVLHHREFFDLWNKRKFFPNRNSFLKLINSNFNYNICITYDLFKYLGLKNNNKNRVIYDGVFSVEDTFVQNTDKREKYFLFVGSIDENKAPDMLIRAFSVFHTKYPDFKLILAGSLNTTSKYYQKCENLVKRSGLEKEVSFLGYRKDVGKLMRHATAVVVCSLTEGFGFVAVEGMLNYTIVIGRNNTGMKEQFDIGLKETGKEIGLRFTNEDELINSLYCVVENDMTEVRERAHDVVCNNYTKEKCIEETEKFYKFVISDYNRNKIK